MCQICKISEENISQCSKIYLSAYSAGPWNEQYSKAEITEYIRKFIFCRDRFGFALVNDCQIVGMMLGIELPCPGSSFFRIEDMCIAPEKQRQGLGSAFIICLIEYLKTRNISSILVNTVKNFPSHAFYIKNGFIDIETSALLAFDIVK